ncbi:PPOX class F420-dependent oxidoreductase [Streptomyces sp. HUAS TT7]|uniref:PPOX class F420-dependent oxidoreductase n=1 Tax=Streptomyces sp. HUAS TT7 TaxID=3447507 RepID=UPI003F658F4C
MSTRTGAGQLADARRLLVTTYGPGGAPVTERRWVIRDGGSALGILTPKSSSLAGRLRAGSGILIGAAALRARAAFLDEESTVCYRTALIDKYGLAAVVMLARARLRHGPAGTVGVRLVVGAGDRGLIGRAWQPDWSYSMN